jgi:hypothetical protein
MFGRLKNSTNTASGGIRYLIALGVGMAVGLSFFGIMKFFLWAFGSIAH